MCTELVAACICNHYQHLRWITRCISAASTSSPFTSSSTSLPSSTPPTLIPSSSTACTHPTAPHIQRVDFQCTPCDALDQALLELSIATEKCVRTAARETNDAGARAQREREGRMSVAELEALRVGAVEEQLEKEREIWKEAESVRVVLMEEWKGRVEGMWVGVEYWRVEEDEGEEGKVEVEGRPNWK